MLAALADLIVRRPWAVLGAAGAALVAAGAIAAGAPEAMGVGSTRADAHPRQPALEIALEPARSQQRTSSFEVSEEVVVSQLEADSAVASVRSVEHAGGSALLVSFGDLSDAERERAVSRLEREIDPGALRASFRGELVGILEARRRLEQDGWRAELLALPLVVLILAGSCGLRRVPAPVLCAGLAIAGSLAVLRVAGLWLDISLLGFIPAAAVGLVLGVELPLLVFRLHDANRGAEGPIEQLAAGFAASVGSLAWIAGLAALSAFALLLVPLDQAFSLVLGAAAAAALAAASAPFVATAVIWLTEDREPRAEPASRGALERRRSLRALRSALLGSRARVTLLATTVTVVLLLWAIPAFDASSAPLGVDQPTAADSLLGELALAGALAAALLGLAVGATTRSPVLVALGPLSVLPAAAAVGITAFVFDDGHGLALFGLDSPRALDSGTAVTACCALFAIAAARNSAAVLQVRRGWPLAGSFVPAAAGTGIAAAGGLALGTLELVAAQQFGFMLAAGTACDLIFVRLAGLGIAAQWLGWPRRWTRAASAS